MEESCHGLIQVAVLGVCLKGEIKTMETSVRIADLCIKT
jgi:hypothetical protein